MVCDREVPAFRHLQNCVPGLRSDPICVSLSPLPPPPAAPECPTSPLLHPSHPNKRVYFSNPPIGDLSLTQEYLHVWNMCLEQFCAAMLFCPFGALPMGMLQRLWLLQGGMCLPWLCVLICPSLLKMGVQCLKTRLLKLASNSVLSA